MKKSKWYLLIFCAITLMLSGCGKKEEVQEVSRTPIKEKIVISTEKIEEDNTTKISDGINKWAKAFLTVNSNAKDRKITDECLYESIVDEKQRNELKEKRKKFYKDSEVTVEEVTTSITSTTKAKYGTREVGVIECVTKAQGKRNDKPFDEKYKMKIIVDYIGDVVSVYEIDNIKWE